jgi:hypothetical protein
MHREVRGNRLPHAARPRRAHLPVLCFHMFLHSFPLGLPRTPLTPYGGG